MEEKKCDHLRLQKRLLSKIDYYCLECGKDFKAREA